MGIVANECDIIESFARHTLTFADHLHVLFHNSYDTSRRIVEQLSAEGLPISFDVATTAAFARERLGNDLVREIAAREHFDYLLPLDADEFIVADSRAELEAELAAVPPGGALSIAWLPYVPTVRDDADDPNPATRIRHRLRSPHPKYRKVFFSASLLGHEDVYLADGNHSMLSRTGRQIPKCDAARVFLAHYPVRGAEQLASKIFIGAMARRLSPDYTDSQSRHWYSLKADRSVTTDMPAAELSRVAMRYLDCTETELVDAPLATAMRCLRYAELVRVNAFERLSAFVEAAFAELAATGLSSQAGEASLREMREELKDARHLVQQLHSDLRAVKRRSSEKARAAKRRARNRTLAAVAVLLLLAAAAMTYVRA